MENELICLPLRVKGAWLAKDGRFELVLYDAEIRVEIVREGCLLDLDGLDALFSSVPLFDVLYALTAAAFFIRSCRSARTVEVGGKGCCLFA
jgi:hypothetical protein